MMRSFNVALACLVSLATVLGVLEGGLRLLGQGPGTKINRPDPQVGWVKRPNFRYRRRSGEFDVTLTTNSLGLRDDPMPSPSKPAGSFRVLCLGDSFVLGYAVARQDLFVDLLEHWWRAEGRSIEVVNAGTEGYSTDQEAAWFEQHGLAFEPDLVLLFPYENDIWWNGSPDYLGTPKPLYSPRGELEGVPLPMPSWFERSALARLFGSKVVGESLIVDGREIMVDFVPLLEDLPALREPKARTRGALAALGAACERSGARLVIVPIPSHASIDPDHAEQVIGPQIFGGLPRERWDPDRPVDFFLAEAQHLGVPALDPRPSLRAARAAGEELYYESDFHLSPAGNRAFAAFLKDGLDQLRVFPPERGATATVQAPPSPTIQERRGAGPPKWPFLFAGLWLVLGLGYVRSNRDEPAARGFLSVGALLAVVFAIALGFGRLMQWLPPSTAGRVGMAAVLLILGFILFKLGRRLGTILELLASFTLRGHWYLMPLVMVLLTVGSLLVVAASSPLVAPFIYTLF